MLAKLLTLCLDYASLTSQWPVLISGPIARVASTGSYAGFSHGRREGGRGRGRLVSCLCVVLRVYWYEF